MELRETLHYDFQMEEEFDYGGLGMSEIIAHLAKFIAGVWQIHVFGEGNTRTTAVFFIQYLKSLGFRGTNDTFAKNAWHFRNALVRANYNNLEQGTRRDTSYLELFLRNLLMGEKHELKNRYLHIQWGKTSHSTAKQNIQQHTDSENSTFDISAMTGISSKTKNNGSPVTKFTLPPREIIYIILLKQV